MHLVLAKKELYDCKRSEKMQEWELLRSKECNNLLTVDIFSAFFPRTCCAKHKRHDKRQPALFKEDIRCTEVLCLCSETYC